MASRDIVDWRPDVRKYIKMPTANESLIDDEVRETCRDFLRETALWKYDLARISVVADQAEYDFTPINADGVNVFSALATAKYKLDGEDDDQFYDLELETRESMQKKYLDAWQFEENVSSSNIYVTKEKKFRLYPIPTVLSTEGLLLHVIVKPSNDATAVPLFVWEDHKRTISIGAASMLMGQTNRPWSDKKLSDRYWVQYTAKRDEAAFTKWDGRTKKALHVRPRIWSSSRNRTWRF